MRVFVLESDKGWNRLMSYSLEHFGYEVENFRNSREFWDRVEYCVPNLIVLSTDIDDGGGYELLKNIREDYELGYIPIILVSNDETEYQKILGLDYGADDYIARPFSMFEFIARIRGLNQRAKMLADADELSYENITISTVENRVLINHKPISLEDHEYEMLKVLMQNRNIILSRNELLDAVWGREFAIQERTVDVYIKRLRKHIGKRASQFIKTVRGKGYVFKMY